MPYLSYKEGDIMTTEQQSVSQQSVIIAKYFFSYTKRRATQAVMLQAISSAKSLLNAGFTKDEIILGIEYCYEHPPKNGFQSLAWLSYDLENILNKIKAQELKQQNNNFEYISNQPTIKEHNTAKSKQDRVDSSFDFNMFE